MFWNWILMLLGIFIFGWVARKWIKWADNNTDSDEEYDTWK